MPVMPFHPSALAVAALLDLAFGEPRNVLHPVAWMGTVVSLVHKHAPQQGRLCPFLTGLALMLSGVGTMIAVGLLLAWTIRLLPIPLAVLAEAAVLKMTFSIRGLARAGRAVQSALTAGDESLARRLLSWHLVSRDTASLSQSQVAAAAIESIAENTSDSIVAPLLFYTCAGLPGALAYRFINTCDAMLGYRDDEREWLGKAAARLDDIANFIPSRLTAALMIAVGALCGRSPARVVAIWWRNRRATASPNAGHPMSAAAGVLSVELEKVGHYCLGRGLAQPTAADVNRAIRLLALSAALACVIFSSLLLVRNAVR